MKNTVRLLPLLLLLPVWILPSGCTTVNTVERADPLATPSYIQDKRVITDQSLAKTVRVLSVNQTTVSGDLLKVQVTVENARTRVRTFNYRFEWYDRDGMLVQTPSSTWKSRRIEGKETLSISDVAPNPRVVDFVLKIMEPR